MNLISSGGTYNAIKDVSDSVDSLDTRVDTLEEGEIYSTTEKVIGKWIDGKKIYRKVYELNISCVVGGWVNSTISATDKDTIINCQMIDTSGVIAPAMATLLQKNSGIIRFYTNMSWGIKKVILEYTKTTD